MSLDILKQRVKSKKLGGLYLFCGADEYTKDHYAGIFKKAASESGFADFNYLIMDGKALDTASLSDALDAYPFMSDLKAILVKTPDLGSKLDEKTADVYRTLFSAIPDQTSLIFFCRSYEFEVKSSKKTAANNARPSVTLFDLINENGVVVEFPQPDRFKISAWISRHFSARGITASPEAIDCMLMVCGGDLYILSGEIDKLCSAAKNGKISEDDVLNYCCANEEFQTFDLANAVADGDCERSRHILNNLAAAKTEPLMILGALSKNFSDMLVIKCGVEERKTSKEISDRLKMNEWAVGKRIASMRGKSVSFLKRAVKECKECDLKQKSFSTDAYLLLGTLVQRLASFEDGKA